MIEYNQMKRIYCTLKKQKSVLVRRKDEIWPFSVGCQSRNDVEIKVRSDWSTCRNRPSGELDRRR